MNLRCQKRPERSRRLDGLDLILSEHDPLSLVNTSYQRGGAGLEHGLGGGHVAPEVVFGCPSAEVAAHDDQLLDDVRTVESVRHVGERADGCDDSRGAQQLRGVKRLWTSPRWPDTVAMRPGLTVAGGRDDAAVPTRWAARSRWWSAAVGGCTRRSSGRSRLVPGRGSGSGVGRRARL